MRTSFPTRRASWMRFVLAVAMLWLADWPARGRDDARAASHQPPLGHAAMSETAMRRWVIIHYGAHPARGERSTAAPSDSFVANNFYFDSNHDGAATQVDTAKIFEGQTILWKRAGGTHTVTSGNDNDDPQAGVLFDQPLTSTAGQTTFSYQFNSAGTYHFFCRVHDLFGMHGVVVVKATAAVDAVPGAPALGFVSPPGPNPTRATTSFRFALSRPGHARADVYDVRGGLVATVLDRELAAGTWDAAWDASRAKPGIYYLRLTLPGRSESRSIVVSR
jgi:plastocyanin